MDVFEDAEGERQAPAVDRDRGDHEAALLWAAIAADHRARDERTSRLRAMRVIRGEAADA